MARLLTDDPELRIAALVEPKMVEPARKAAGEMTGGDRIEVLEGDITDRRLGLADSDFERLQREVVTAFHLAAVYNLAVPYEIAQRVNVEGTGNVLELCRRCDQLERLNYVSTAYVAGDRDGVVYEHELEMGQGFKNHYESTKFQAEVWVRGVMDRVPTTVYRPAIVVGDARTGETQKFDGPYYMLRMLSVARRRKLPILQFGRAEAHFNVVPVDFIIEALAAVGEEPRAVGQTLHLVDPDPVTSAELLAMLSREYMQRDPSFRVPPRVASGTLRFAAMQRAFGGVPRQSIDYLNHPVHFDTRRASDLLERVGLTVPRFQDYVGNVVRYFREHEDDPDHASTGL